MPDKPDNHVGWVHWPFSYQYADGLLALRMVDGSRAWFKNGKLYIKQDQLDAKLVLIQAELEGTDFAMDGSDATKKQEHT